jgi:hypothetical protein
MWKSRVGVWSLALILLLSIVTPALASEATDLESDFLGLLNDERRSNGLAPLLVMSELVAGARSQAQAMAEAGFLFHNPDLGSVLADGWAKLGENVGIGYSAESLHQAFMNSPGHRDNVLDTGYEYVGIGVVLEDDGAIWVAFVFVDMIGTEPREDLQPYQYDGRFSDDDDSVFEQAIETLAAAGITKGCGDTTFCPDQPVTRGQMAAFLVRVLDLDPVAGNPFSDDDGSPFEGAIESLAAAGITNGCAGHRFCPDAPISRGQMAAFLTRAAGLPPAGGNSFFDDDQSPFEDAIEALAAAGVTNGCADGRFCPDEPVTRGQMAAFLVGTFDLPK